MEGAALFAWDTEAQEVVQTRQSGKDEGKQKKLVTGGSHRLLD